MKKENISIFGKKFLGDIKQVAVGKIDVNTIKPIQLLHEIEMANRRREAANADDVVFDIHTSDDLLIEEDVPNDELEAEKLVPHKRLVIATVNLEVIHGHETVLKAKEHGEESVLVLQILSPLKPKDIFLIQTRYAAKEGCLLPAPRTEAIRRLHDDYKYKIDSVRKLLVNPKGKSPSPKEVTSELRVGKLFQKYPGYRIPFTGHELDKGSFSNLKYLVGNGEIYNYMQESQEKEEQFLRMAITSSKTKTKRLNTEIPALTKHPETKQALFEQGLPQAKALLKSLYPEENRNSHPFHDLIAANSKLEKKETLILLQKQLESNPKKNPTFRQVLNLNETICDLSEEVKTALLEKLFQDMPEEFVSVAVSHGYEEVIKAAKSKSKNLVQISKALSN